MATISCNCGAVKIQLKHRAPLLTGECCCVDCLQKNDHAAACGGPPTPPEITDRKRPPLLTYWANVFSLTGEVKFQKLRESCLSTNMVCASCGTVLLVDNPFYRGKRCLSFSDWARHDMEVGPPQLRFFVKDWTEELLARVQPLPGMYIQDGQVQFVNCDQETFAGFMVEREVPEPGPGDTNFQQLQEGRDVEIIALPENPMSFNKKSS